MCIRDRDCTAALEVEGATAELTARALINRGAAKGSTGDHHGEIADCTAALEVEGATAETTAWALINRGAAKGSTGDHRGAIADWAAVLQTNKATTEDWIQAALGVLASSAETERVLDGVATVVAAAADRLGHAPACDANDTLTTLLNRAAHPFLREAWPQLWHGLQNGLADTEAAAKLHALEPVAEVLESGSRAVLNELPPEEREFAELVLQRFEPQPQPEKPDG